MNNDKVNYGRNLKILMAYRGITATELAAQAEISPLTISFITNGRILSPRAGTLEKMAKILRVEAGEFYRTDLVVVKEAK